MPINTKSNLTIRMTIFCAMFTALIVVGAYMSVPIPISPVPIAMADAFVMLTGLMLGRKYAVISTAVYLILGAVGLPVFAGQKGGFGVLFGPTGGYLFGYLLLAFCVGFIVHRQNHPGIIRIIIALLIGNLFLYIIGIAWLKIWLHADWSAAIAAGFTPFAIGIVFKIAMVAALGRILLPHFKKALHE